MPAYMNRVTHLAAVCPECGAQAEAFWLILHEPGCPAGEEIDNDEQLEEESEEVT